MLQSGFCYCQTLIRPYNSVSMTRSLLSRLGISTLPFAIALFSASGSAQTETEEDERWYQAEIIVFEIREKNATESEEITSHSGEEIWPDDPGLPDYDGVIELSPPLDPSQTETALELEEALNDPAQIRSQGDRVPSGFVDERLTPLSSPLETATQETGSAAVDTAIEKSVAAELPFRLLPDEALTLTEIAAALDSSPNYVPILHIGWRQPVPPKARATRIYLHSNLGQLPAEAPLELTAIDELMQPRELIDSPLLLTAPDDLEAAPGDAVALNRLDGTLTLYLGRYLHLQADLLYRSQTEPLEPNTFFVSLSEEELPQTLFRMHQSRRMRSDELHYFDHPMFGMLALLTPYELPEPEVIPADEEEPDPLRDDPSAQPVTSPAAEQAL